MWVIIFARSRVQCQLKSSGEFYLAGIRNTMDYYGADAGASYYIQDGVAYTNNQAENLRLIARQKWLSLFMVGLEAWFDYRRTGLPALTPGPDATLPTLPVRAFYPDDEQVLNAENYAAAVGSQGPDELVTEMWILE